LVYPVFALNLIRVQNLYLSLFSIFALRVQQKPNLWQFLILVDDILKFATFVNTSIRWSIPLYCSSSAHFISLTYPIQTVFSDISLSTGEEPTESLFMKELKRRGMTPTSLLEESWSTLKDENITLYTKSNFVNSKFAYFLSMLMLYAGADLRCPDRVHGNPTSFGFF
jgi:hypothetical protein